MRRLDRARTATQEIKTPLLYNKALWEKSGHWGKYRENMFLVLDSETGEHDFSLKPMNCPSHHLYFGFKKHSYRELPLRYSTQDVLHRNEASGSLGGLTRVRQFAQDDAHIYCTEGQIADEVKRFIQLLDQGLRRVRPDLRRPSSPPGRRSASATTRSGTAPRRRSRSALKSLGCEYEQKPGDGAFYGPKIDFDVNDSIGRKWQLGTIQLDYNAPERFDLAYVGEDNAEHRPVVLHRAIYGSLRALHRHPDRALRRRVPGLARPGPGAARHRRRPAAATTRREVLELLRARGFRVELDERGMTMNAKIREAQLQKIPFTLVIGDREVEQRAVAPRRYGGEDLKSMPLDAFLELLSKEAAVP